MSHPVFFYLKDEIDPAAFMEWCDGYQAQIVVLAAQILWSEDVEAALTSGGGAGLDKVLRSVENTLTVLADCVLQKQPPLRRRKLEALVNYSSSESKYVAHFEIYTFIWS